MRRVITHGEFGRDSVGTRPCKAAQAAAPTFVSATYRAGGRMMAWTVLITGRIPRTRLRPVGHLTEVNDSVAEFRPVGSDAVVVGLRNRLALGDGLPGDRTVKRLQRPAAPGHASGRRKASEPLRAASGLPSRAQPAATHGLRPAARRQRWRHVVGQHR
jgi:hypothetical protein